MTVPGSTNFVLRQPSLPVPCRPTLVVAFKETDRLVWVQLAVLRQRFDCGHFATFRLPTGT